MKKSLFVGASLFRGSTQLWSLILGKLALRSVPWGRIVVGGHYNLYSIILALAFLNRNPIEACVLCIKY
jgi:hypothetical protein